jgi:hypothetical protein
LPRLIITVGGQQASPVERKPLYWGNGETILIIKKKEGYNDE